jgi:hypothetical protein
VGRIHWEARPLLRTAIVSILSGGVAWAGVRLLDGPAGLVVGLLAGSVVFLALGALLRILPADDAHWLDQSVGGRFFQRWSRQWQEAEPASWSVPPAAGSKRQP